MFLLNVPQPHWWCKAICKGHGGFQWPIVNFDPNLSNMKTVSAYYFVTLLKTPSFVNMIGRAFGLSMASEDTAHLRRLVIFLLLFPLIYIHLELDVLCICTMFQQCGTSQGRALWISMWRPNILESKPLETPRKLTFFLLCHSKDSKNSIWRLQQ